MVSSIPLKLLEYFRNHLTSRKFNLGPGKKLQLVDFVNYLESNAEIEVTDDYYNFKKTIGSQLIHFCLRRKSSDPYVYNQIIENEEYGFLTDFFEDRSKEYIFLDIGANVGLTTLYMKAHFPHAKIYSLEPEPSNFERLKHHISLNSLMSVVAINKGLFTSDGVLYSNRTFRDKEHWSFRLDKIKQDPDAVELEVVSLDTILMDNDLDKIDFLKMDIEGGELALLQNEKFLQIISARVKVIMMEIHPEVIDYSEAKQILRSRGFLVFDSVGSSVGLNKQLVTLNE
jgi:FkbM family methyltransferase